MSSVIESEAFYALTEYGINVEEVPEERTRFGLVYQMEHPQFREISEGDSIPYYIGWVHRNSDNVITSVSFIEEK